MKKKLIFLLLVFVVLATTGFGCSGASQQAEEAMQPITLTYWRTWDDSDAFDDIIAAYKAIHPNITIEYKKFQYGEYEDQLLNAFAEDRGPDIFAVHNTWMQKYQNKLAPLPAQITLAYPIVQGTINQTTIPQLRTTNSLTLKDLRNNFVDTVYDNVVLDTTDEKTKKTTEQIYGLPLSVDTLALYYNRDLFNRAGIATPPAYWNREFQLDVKNLTLQDAQGNIIQSGIALGGSKNIERYSDILSILMMQNGAQMMGANGSVTFNQIPDTMKSQGYNPGLEALRFYKDFTTPAKEVYCWNDQLEDSLQMFEEGKLGMMLGYAYFQPTIQAQAPKLNYDIVPLPQIDGSQSKTNFANFWVEGVSKKSKNIDAAWDFVQFETKAEQVKSYLEATKKPTALRSLINDELEDPSIGVFASQLLTAKSWYKGKDSNAMELIFADLIDQAGRVESSKLLNILNLAASQVQQTVK